MIKNMHLPAFENLLEKLGESLNEFGFETNYMPISEDQPIPMLDVTVLTEDELEEGEEPDELSEEDDIITAQLFISEVPNSESPEFINLQIMIPVYINFDDVDEGNEDEDEDEADETFFHILVALPHINNRIPYGFFSMTMDNSIVYRATVPGWLSDEFNPELVNGVLDSAFFAVYEFGDILSALADNEITLENAMAYLYDMEEELLDGIEDEDDEK